MNSKVVVDHEHVVNNGQFNTNRYYLAGRLGRGGHYSMTPKEFGQALAKKRGGKKAWTPIDLYRTEMSLS